MAGPWEDFANDAPQSDGPWSDFQPKKPTVPIGGTPEFDEWFAQTSNGKILDAFKQGAKDGWGTSNLGMGPETEDFLKKAGVFDDYADGQKHLLKQFNEAIIRPAVVAGDAAFRALNAGFGAFQEGVSQIGKETEGTRAGDALGLPSLFRDVAAMPEAFMGSPHPTGIPGLPEPIARAKSLRVIGDGESGYMETVEAKPRDPAEAAAEAIRDTPAETQQPDTIPAEPEKPDLHATARQLAPDVFNEYDDLSTRRDTFSRWMNELRQSQRDKAESPFKDEIDALNDKIEDATPRLQKKYAERIADLEEQRDAAVEQAMREPSADMDRVRQAYQETDYRMRDLAPEVSAAYREAESRIGPIEVNPAPDVAREPEVPPAPVQEPVRPAEPIPEPVAPKTETAQPQVPAEPTTPERAAVPPNGIAIDVAKKLMEAGRPEAEARAAASIISAYYETRAKRFGGKRGTAEDLYREDAPQIRAGKAPAQRVKELAQKNGAKELEQPAYHGSPFHFDKFTLDHIGKGEGAQAYGWGLYFAGNKKVAEFYRDALAPTVPLEDVARIVSAKVGDAIERGASKDQVDEYLRTVRKFAFDDAPLAERAKHLGYQVPPLRALSAAERATLLKDVAKEKAGRLYHVDIAPTDAELLDWDKTWDQQPAKVRAVLEKIGLKPPQKPVQPSDPVIADIVRRALKAADGDPRQVEMVVDNDRDIYKRAVSHAEQNGVQDVAEKPGVGAYIADQAHEYLHALDEAKNFDGGTIYKKMEALATADANYVGSAAEYASKKLLAAGIRGIKYLDRVSRGEGEGSHNYVIFDGADVAIKEFEQARRGKISIVPNGEKIITLFKDADASTFLHETGHQFLEDLIADSNHEQATPDLKADARSVLDWLGVKSAEDIKTRQHEKFARGFERYLMEGVAPSKGLAHVFAQFRDWLTKIYQTVKNLKSPINDDIRGVFDRMLAEKPERTVIAPDRDTKGSFADIHEADAETTPPEKAHPVAETVQGERDKIAAERIPDDDHARLENTPDEARSRTAGSAEPDGHDDAAEPIAGEAGDAQGAGAVGAGGGETPRGGAGTRAKPTEPPAGPNARFAEPESALVDKAGNIRLDKLNQPDDIDDAIREAARRNNDFIDQRRGVISDGQALDLAEALGREPAFLDLKKIGDAFNEEEIIAAKNLLIRSATDVRDAMAKAATGTAEDVVALAQAITKHEMIQGKVAQATAEWGRAGRAFRMVMDGSAEAKDLSQFLKDNTGRSFNQLKQMAEFGQRLQTAGQVSRFIDQTAAGKVKRAVIYYYVNALISGPITHTRYSVGNAINAIWTPLVEVPVAATIGAVREAVAGHPIDRVYFGESAAQLYGVMKGSRDGLTAAIEAFRSGNSPALPKEKIASQFVDQPLSPVTGALSTAIGVPGRSVAAIHSFFKSLRYEQNIGALAYREAMKEGAQGPAFEYRVAELTRTPTDSMMEGATKDALKELYMSPTDYHSSMGALTRFTNQNLVAKIMMPFMKIGTQITRNAFVERTPLGLASSDVRGNLFSGMAKGDMQAAKITTGVALMGTTVLMASEGLATGDGPSDPATRAIWLMSHRPNSIQIGDITLPYQGLGHLGMLMRFSANMYETAHGWDGNDGAKLAVAGFEAITKSVLDENFMRGMKDALDALYHPAEYGGQYIRNFVTNWMPYSVGLSQVARQIDPYQRETHSIFEQAKAHVPWLSETLMPRRDRFGEPIPNGPPNPAYANDPTVKALDQLNIGIGKLDGKIRNVELTPKQYDDYARVAGRLTKMRLDQMVAQPGWQQIPPAIRVELIHSAISGSREAARATIMAENHGIIEAAVNAKVIPLQTGELKAKGPTKQKEAQ